MDFMLHGVRARPSADLSVRVRGRPPQARCAARMHPSAPGERCMASMHGTSDRSVCGYSLTASDRCHALQIQSLVRICGQRPACYGITFRSVWPLRLRISLAKTLPYIHPGTSDRFIVHLSGFVRCLAQAIDLAACGRRGQRRFKRSAASRSRLAWGAFYNRFRA